MGSLLAFLERKSADRYRSFTDYRTMRQGGGGKCRCQTHTGIRMKTTDDTPRSSVGHKLSVTPARKAIDLMPVLMQRGCSRI
jgi:hypothetical protein